MGYDLATSEGGRFAAYDTLLKMVKASGFPGWVQDPDDRDRYVEQF
jgi:hypothetical protein